MTEAIVDLLLARGEGATDKDMIEAVEQVGGFHRYGDEIEIKGLQRVAREETPPVRERACYFLAGRKRPCEEIPAKK